MDAHQGVVAPGVVGLSVDPKILIKNVIDIYFVQVAVKIPIVIISGKTIIDISLRKVI